MDAAIDHQRLLRHQRYRLVGRIDRLLDGPATYLAFVFAAALVIDLVLSAQHEAVPPMVTWLERGIWAFFVLHFAIEIVLAPDRLRYLRSHWITAVSPVIPFLRVVRIVRFVGLLRATNLVRVFGALNRTTTSLQLALAWNGAGLAIGLSVSVTFLASAGIWAFEAGEAVTPFHSYADAVWWVASTLTTVGGGNPPVTLGGRVIALFVMVSGLVLLGYVAGLLGAVLFRRSGAKRGGRAPG